MNEIATTERSTMNQVAVSSGAHGSSIAPQSLGDVVRFAEVMCRADIALPKHLRGNAGACMAVALQALEWQMSPFAVASKSYAVNGAIAYEAQLIAAVVNTRSGIKGRLKYEFLGEGNEMTCRVTGILDGDECAYETPPIGSITVKNSPLWKSDPRQQLGYFAARSWARRHCPEVILGVYDREETESFQGPDNAKDVTPSLAERLAIARADTGEPASEREGFDRSFVDRETGATPAASEIENHEPSDAAALASDDGRDVASPPADVAAPPNPEAKATEDNAITTATMRSDGPGVASRVDAGRSASATSEMNGRDSRKRPAPNSNASEGYDSSDGASDDSGGAGSTATDGAAATPSAEAADQAAGENGSESSPAAELECISKLMAIVADPALTPKEAAQTLAESADIWLGALGPERKAFVTAVFTTSKKVLRNELQPPAARKYLESLVA